MTRLEWKKIEANRRKIEHDRMEQARSVGFVYPPDLHYFWEYMQKKGIGLPYCLGMVYQLGFVAGQKKAASYPTDQSE